MKPGDAPDIGLSPARGALRDVWDKVERTQDAGPRASAVVVIEANLDAELPVTAPAHGAAIDFGDDRTYNHAAALTVFDAQGQPVALSCWFQKAATDRWHVFVSANGSPVAGTPAAPRALMTLGFTRDGRAAQAPSRVMSFDVPAGAASGAIPGLRLDARGTTQFASAFLVSKLSQDGLGADEAPCDLEPQRQPCAEAARHRARAYN